MPQYATVAAPVTQLTTKNYQNKFSWTEECNKSFKKLKDLLCSAPVLSYPNFKHEFILQTDASDVGLAAKDSRCTLSAILNLIASNVTVKRNLKSNLVVFARLPQRGDKTYITNRFF